MKNHAYCHTPWNKHATCTHFANWMPVVCRWVCDAPLALAWVLVIVLSLHTENPAVCEPVNQLHAFMPCILSILFLLCGFLALFPWNSIWPFLTTFFHFVKMTCPDAYHLKGACPHRDAHRHAAQLSILDIYDQLHHTFYAPKPEAAKKGAAAAGQQPAPSPSAASEATKQHGLPQQQQHQQPPPGSQAAPIVLRPPPHTSSQQQAVANEHQKPATSAAASTSLQHAMEEGELPEGGAPRAQGSARVAAAAAQGHQQHGMLQQGVSQHQQGATVPLASSRTHGATASQTRQPGTALPQGEGRVPGQDGGSRKVARVGEQQFAGPGGQQQQAQLH
eukprot:scaffold16661_cov18-Tisochrysis_lutea.AAC.1